MLLFPCPQRLRGQLRGMVERCDRELTKHNSARAVVGIEESDAYFVARLKFDFRWGLEGERFLVHRFSLVMPMIMEDIPSTPQAMTVIPLPVSSSDACR